MSRLLSRVNSKKPSAALFPPVRKFCGRPAESEGLFNRTRRILTDLMETEQDPTRRAKMETIEVAFYNLVSSKELLVNSKELLLRKSNEVNELLKSLVTSKEELKEGFRLQLLQAKGLNNTRGLFEYLQEQIYKQYAETNGKKGSADLWNVVMKKNPALHKCLRKHLGKAVDIGVQIATLYQILSQHVHAGSDLSLHKGSIEFEVDNLSPQQVQIMLCLGTAGNVPIAAAPRRSL